MIQHASWLIQHPRSRAAPSYDTHPSHTCLCMSSKLIRPFFRSRTQLHIQLQYIRTFRLPFFRPCVKPPTATSFRVCNGSQHSYHVRCCSHGSVSLSAELHAAVPDCTYTALILRVRTAPACPLSCSTLVHRVVTIVLHVCFGVWSSQQLFWSTVGLVVPRKNPVPADTFFEHSATNASTARESHVKP